MTVLPVGKLPPDVFTKLLSHLPVQDPRILLGPGVGLDCAVIDIGPNLLVFKSDPITFATENIGWYMVQINANDIATTGAIPRWLLVTLLLPERKTNQKLIDRIMGQVSKSCQKLGISIIGGHTEITYGLDRPILAGTMIGEVGHDDLVTPLGANPGDRILLTKGVPIEATAILAREFPERLSIGLSEDEINQARSFLSDPGINVLPDAQIAVKAGKITAMHDPTEGGLSAALWELAEASSRCLYIDPSAIHIPSLSARICQILHLDPMASISSGALLLTVHRDDSNTVQKALMKEGILCSEIGVVESGPVSVWMKTENGRRKMPRPTRDEIAKLFDE